MQTSYQVFSEPKNAFEDIFRELQKASKSIYIESFLLDDDSIGQRLISILKQKAKEIPVTVLIDDYGFKTPSKKTLQEILDSNIDFFLFNPVRKVMKTSPIAKWSQGIRLRNHRKLTLIDSSIAYVGGLNYSARELNWRDLMVKMRGSIVHDLKIAAKEMRKIHGSNWPFKEINPELTKRKHICRQIPYSKHKPLRKQIEKMMSSAKEEIFITTPYFVPDVPFLNLLRKTIKRRINITLLVPQKSDHYFADILSDFFIRVAHQLGVKVYTIEKMTHAKYLVADSKVCTFGSANFDYQAFYKNYELNIISKDKQLIRTMRNIFLKDLKQAKIFSPNLKRNKNLFRKTLEKILLRFRHHF